MQPKSETGAGAEERSPDTEEKDDHAALSGGQNHRLRNIVIGAAAILILGGAYYAWDIHSARYPSTSDAYVGANVVHVAPQVSGTVEAVGPESFSHVSKGDLLVRIDRRPFQASVDIAEAALAQARQKVATMESAANQARADLATRNAALEDAAKEEERVKKLVADGALPKSRGDAQTAALREARAGKAAAESALASAEAALGTPGDRNPLVLAAKAKLEQARLDLANTTITAQADGYIGKIDVRPGSMAGAGIELMQLVETDTWWVDANFKETDLDRIKSGQKAKVSVDLLPAREFTGEVIALSPASGAAFSLFPPDNATGNWVKVAQRFPVRIRLDPPAKTDGLRLGASSRVTVDTVTD